MREENAAYFQQQAGPTLATLVQIPRSVWQRWGVLKLHLCHCCSRMSSHPGVTAIYLLLKSSAG